MSRVIVFGEILADVFPDITVLGGAPFNVARHLHAFHQSSILISKVGNDALKNQFYDYFSTTGMAWEGIQVDDIYPTGQVLVNTAADTHSFDILPNQAYDYIADDCIDYIWRQDQPELVYFGSLIQRSSVSSTTLQTLLKTTTCKRFVDLNLRQPWYNKAIISYTLSEADFLKLSEEELMIVADMFGIKHQHIQETAQTLLQLFSLQILFITLGDQGAWAFSANKEAYYQPAIPMIGEEIDTVGAGDGFASIAILGILQCWPLAQTLQRANQFAATVCQSRGAALDPDDYQRFLSWLSQ